MSRPYEYLRRDEWEEIPPGCIQPPPKPQRPLTLRQRMERLQWIPIAEADWRGTTPTPGLPVATHRSRITVNSGTFHVYRLDNGAYVFDVGARDEFSAPPIHG